MIDVIVVALPGVYHTSVGAMFDCHSLVRVQAERLHSQGSSVEVPMRLRTLSPSGRPVPLIGGRILDVDGAIADSDGASFVWLPNVQLGTREALEERMARSGAVFEWLRTQYARGAVIGASGAACLLLIAAGLADTVKVPVARAVSPLAKSMFPHQRFEERLGAVEAGQLFMSNGLGNDLALIGRALSRLVGESAGRWISSITGADVGPETALAMDLLVARAQVMIEQRFNEQISIDQLASELSTSQSTLLRRFQRALGMTPKAYLQGIRFLAARRMLDSTELTVDQIAELVGFSDSRVFRSMFRRQAGMTAREWRARTRALAGQI